jgi:hypothetical protein
MRLKSVLLGVMLTLCNVGYAEIIELDNQDPDHCRQQVISDKDDVPVVLAYFSWCEPAKEFIQNIFEPVAKEHPERTFFKFNMDNTSDWQAFNHCLQLSGHLGSPTSIIYKKFTNPQTGAKILIGPLRMSVGSNVTKEEFLKLIDMNGMNKKTLSFVKK